MKYTLFAWGLMIISTSYCLADERVIARLNGHVITYSMLDLEVAKLVPRAFFHRSVPDERMKEVRKRALQSLIEAEMLHAEALSRGMRPDDGEVQKRIGNIRKKYPSQKDFDVMLQGRGLTEEVLAGMVKKEVLAEQLLKKEIDDRIDSDEGALRKFFEENREMFREPEKVRVFHITVGVDPSSTAEQWQAAAEKAEDLVRRIRAGEEFAGLASKYSSDAYRVKGGDLGLVHRGRLEPALEDVIFSLREGETAPPVKSMYGFHVMKAGERVPERMPEFSEARAGVEMKFSVSRKKELSEELLAYLRNKYLVEIVDLQFR